MEQSKFIFEVQSRQCIWNPFVFSYLDRLEKQQAWKEVAAKMYQEFDSCSDSEKTEKVRELQKKWKSLKDYYRRRNPKEDIDKHTKEKKPIIVLLQFLDKVTKFNHLKKTQQQFDDRIKKIKNKKLSTHNPRKINFLPPKQNLDHESQQNQVKFLLSLLPLMQSLTDRQRFQFKLEIMMLIKKIKYEEEEDTGKNQFALEIKVEEDFC